MPETKKIRPVIFESSPPPSIPEKAETDERQKREEPAPSTAVEKPQESFIAPSASAPKSPIPTPSSPLSPQEEEVRVIEQLLQEGLEETYWQLPPALQTKFREQGEKTAQKIERLLRHVHVNIMKILKLIRKWLSIIPNVNTFFLEQEAKIKTDKITAQHNERNRSA